MKSTRQLALSFYFTTNVIISYCCQWQFCFLTEMYMPVYPPSVVASVSYCAQSLFASIASVWHHHISNVIFIWTQGKWERKSNSVCRVCFIASISSSSHFLIFIRTARMTASLKTSLTILLLSLSLRRKEKEAIICQCRMEVHIKITCTKSQGQHEPYVSHVPSSTRLWSCQVQWPWSRVKITVRGHSVFWMDLHLWTAHEGHGWETLDLIW